jgi:phosphohistidine phosphatase SixA
MSRPLRLGLVLVVLALGVGWLAARAAYGSWSDPVFALSSLVRGYPTDVGAEPLHADPGLADVIETARLGPLGEVIRREDPPRDLVEQLRRGGHVLLLRHGRTDWSRGDLTRLDLTDPGTQRLLAPIGRRQARAIARGVCELGVPVGPVLSSPYDRALETAALAFGRERVQTTDDLIAEDYPGADPGRIAVAARGLAATNPPAGTNTALVTHVHTMYRATGHVAAEGEAVVLRPGAPGGVRYVGRISAEDWSRLAPRASRRTNCAPGVPSSVLRDR